MKKLGINIFYKLLSTDSNYKFNNKKKNIFKNKININLKNNILIIIITKLIILLNLIFITSSNSEIIIKINTTGLQEIIYNDFKSKPNKTYVNNDEITTLEDNNKVNLNDQENYIKMIWYSQLTTCEQMFLNLNNIIEVDLSKFDSSQVSSMKRMFCNCTNISLINITKDFDTSSTNSMEEMFHNCYSLAYLDVSNFKTSLVKNFDFLFSECNSLISLNISNFITSNAISLRYMFSGCYLLTSLDLSNFDTSLATDIHGMFKDCKSLTSLNLFNFNTSLITSLEELFKNCESLITLNISNFDTSKVNNMKNLFQGCKKLTSLNLNNFNTLKVETMQYMFSGCNELISLDLSNFLTPLLVDMQHMFSYCYKLLLLNISNFDTSLVTRMKSLLYNCNTITSIDLSSFNTSRVTNMNNMFDGCTNLFYVNLYNFIENSTLENSNMFKGTSDNLVYCINYKLDVEKIESQLKQKQCSVKDCSINWEENLFNEEKNNIDIYNNECVYGVIKYISETFFITNRIPNISIYSYKIDSNIDELKDKYYNISIIDFSSENIDFLIKKFNLGNENNNIYVLISDLPDNDSWTATSDYNFKLLLENGTELNLNNINEDFYVNISVPIRNLDLANFDYAIYFSKQGYDIYDKNNSFYNDICSSAYYYENNIIIQDRKKDIYPNNVTLCKNSCEYKEVNIEEKRIVCECNLNSKNNNNQTSSTENKDFLDEEESNNFINYFLDNINYKIFTCYKLLLSFNNLKGNIAFYLLLSVFIIISFFNFKFLICGITNIRISLYKEIPTKEKIINILKDSKKGIKYSPPRKKSNKAKTSINSRNKKFNNDTKNTFLLTNSKSNFNPKNKELSNKNYLNNFKTDINKNFNKKNLKIFLFEIKEKNKFKENRIKDDEFYNELPYTRAIIEDNRNIFQFFKSFLFEKIELINLFIKSSKIKDILICEYILSLLIDFFFNTLLYSDNVVSHKYHNNGKLDFVVIFIISLLSNIFTSILCYYLNNSKWIEEKYENISEIKKEFKYLLLSKRFLKYIKIKILFFIVNEIIIIILSFYYVIIFCVVYNQTQVSLLTNYIVSLLEGLIKSIIIIIIIVVTRKIGIYFLNMYFYNASKYINSNF